MKPLYILPLLFINSCHVAPQLGTLPSTAPEWQLIGSGKQWFCWCEYVKQCGPKSRELLGNKYNFLKHGLLVKKMCIHTSVFREQCPSGDRGVCDLP